ncbi:Uu.00g028250.m01.CDS01 [Anthostomella pinea]|uniref:Uu.00g028250.m01.CDS01 n=1 Tax=Anthostomella pinea TaxID=933095 RepID=A0AAI8V8D8_9PEZI|nr:Uu.00g028250.m01.CDS01 [Anthostomella pinea]
MASNFMPPSEPEPIPLPDRFAKIKRNLIACKEKAVADSFYRLLRQLRKEANHIAASGSDIIPTIDYFDIHDESKAAPFKKALQKRGVAVVRRVIPPNVALSWKEETQDYLRHNPHTKGSPAHDPQLYELYWSPGQIRARADSRLLEAQRFAMSAWHSSSEDALISSDHPVAYADRLIMRHPGDNTSLGTTGPPHIAGGSVERWERDGYGRAGTYNKIFQGRWEEHDPWDSSARLGATTDLYNGAGSCSMFRMFQGWLSLSTIAPGGGGGGSLLACCPMLQLTTAYLLLRPFFSPRRGPDHFSTPDNPNPSPYNLNNDTSSSNPAAAFLHENNWNLRVVQNSVLHGAIPGYIQELTAALHPHLRLPTTMVSLPHINPGDYVIWHPDLVTAADPIHLGLSPGPQTQTQTRTQPQPHDASVLLYVPACPLTATNALYLARQRRAFLLGLPAPDFEANNSSYIRGGRGGGGFASKGEKHHAGRPGVQDVCDAGGEEGLRSMGLSPWDEDERERAVMGAGRSGGADGDGNTRNGSRAEEVERELLRLASGILFPDRFDAMYRKGTKRP